MSAETNGFLKNCWYVAAWDHELEPGKLLARTILDRPIAHFRRVLGKQIDAELSIYSQ